jgi:hypothetical protein
MPTKATRTNKPRTRTAQATQPTTGLQQRADLPAAGVMTDGAPVPHALTEEETQLLSAAVATGGTLVTDGVTAVPTMAPPLVDAAATVNAVGTAISGQKVVATWAEQSNRNAWAYLQTAGWKKLSPLTDTGSTTMTLLAAHARATGSAPYADENPAGTIGTLYVW